MTRLLGPEFRDALEMARAAVEEHTAVRRAEAERKRASAQRAEWERAADARGVPVHEVLRDCILRPDLAGPCITEVRRAVRWQRERKITGGVGGGGVVLFLSGDPGCGKTVALAWACARYVPPPLAKRPAGKLPGDAARFAYASDVVRLGAARFGPELEQAQAILGARLLCLDEAGVESDPSLLAEQLMRRIADERPTLLATNLTPEQIEQRYFTSGAGAGRLQSRLVGQHVAGQPWLYVCTDSDRRLGL